MTSEIRAVVVDDEPLALRRIVRLLQREPDVEVVGTRDGGRGAVAAIQELRPDLVFLDVQMPEMNGIEVVRALPPEQLPLVVFVTAFDQFAVQAFEVHALDYLLKPFKAQRFYEALRRARSHLEQAPRNVAAQLERMSRAEPATADAAELEPGGADREPITRILVKADGKLSFVRTADVDWFESENNYVRLHVGPKSYLVRGRMTALEPRLPAGQFVRIHRSVIVNMDRIKEIYPWFGGDYVVTLHDGTELKLTRFYRTRLLQRID